SGFITLRLAVEETPPCGPRLLVRAPEETEVIDLESIGATKVRGLEHQVLSGDFAELQFLRVAGGGGRGGMGGNPRVGALVIVNAVCLRRQHHRSTPLHLALVE